VKPVPAKSQRKAVLLNTLWPGTGQVYLGQFKIGLTLAGVFGALFMAAIGLFLVGMKVYLELSMDGKILEGDRLERIGDAFNQKWLTTLMVLALVVYVVSLVALYAVPAKTPAAAGKPTGPPPVPPPLPPPLLK
jgi:hypothetical protein